MVCAITNNDQAGTLVVIKHVVNDHGGTAVAGDFTMSVAGGSPAPGSFAGVDAPGTSVSIGAGPYSVTESGPSGYAASFSADCSGTIAVGQVKTCTIINDDQAAHLRLVKAVTTNNGGTAVPGDFTLYAAGPTSFSGNGDIQSDVDAGTYQLSESTVDGYTGGGWVCEGGTQTGDLVALTEG